MKSLPHSVPQHMHVQAPKSEPFTPKPEALQSIFFLFFPRSRYPDSFCFFLSDSKCAKKLSPSLYSSLTRNHTQELFSSEIYYSSSDSSAIICQMGNLEALKKALGGLLRKEVSQTQEMAKKRNSLLE
ncbi:hypothetical protein NE237_031144 [Protea cynaroides]|uniref:Uncharacterized protein n=1 Tax=Protea cynaroides TaxID=273540 RepID=A0A9Q0R281_9MAGN|nr:hypothetical protein NE237_031144 [Protea cynaroides]